MTVDIYSPEFETYLKNECAFTPWGEIGYITFKRCVHIDTPILCGDFKWRAAGTLKEDDEIIGFDEEPAYKKFRYIKFGTVTHNHTEMANCVGIKLENGEILYSTPDHSWLVKSASNQFYWKEAKDLLKTKKNHEIYLPRIFGKPWQDKNTYEAGYLAASFDGEGSLDRTNSLCFTQVQNKMKERVEEYIKELNMTYKVKERNNKSNTLYKRERQKVYDLKIYGIKNIIKFVSENNCQRISVKLKENMNKKYQTMRCAPEDLIKVVDVFDAGEMPIAVLSTSLKTHFTDGFPSHNTYARRLNEEEKDSPTEEFWQVIQRELAGIKRQLKLNFTDEEIYNYVSMRSGLKGSVAGRFMWQLNTTTVDKLGLPSLQNCAFTTIEHPIRSFTWAMELLMLGCGVGFNIQHKYVDKLPEVKGTTPITRQDNKSADYIIPDTREGWIKLLGKVLKSYFYSGKGFTYSTQLIRGEGAPIKGFGGTSSGPEILVGGINSIIGVLQSRVGKKLRPIDCLDILNIIGEVVVAGNVRRSAELAIGDYWDLDFLKAKRWDLGNVPNWRSNSNNSIAAPEDLHSLPPEYWDTYKQGEPYGLINLELSRSTGRVGKGGKKYKDLNIEGYNPCAEQGLVKDETCCLAEIVLCNITSYEELMRVIKLLYKVAKHSLAIPCNIEETETIVHKNMRMGLGITGYLQSTEEQKSWLSKAYEELREFDKEYSAQMMWPTSIKLTTFKPSGTQSLLPGVTPGANPNPAGPFFIRRIRISSQSDLVDVCRENGYPVEYAINYDGSFDRTTCVVSFPCKIPDWVPVAKNFSWKDQLDTIRRCQREWSDNAVSCTVTYKIEELNDIKEYLYEHFNKEIKTVSFLLYQDHGFKQAPYEDITEEQYNEMILKVKPITSVEVNENDFESQECAGGACPIK